MSKSISEHSTLMYTTEQETDAYAQTNAVNV